MVITGGKATIHPMEKGQTQLERKRPGKDGSSSPGNYGCMLYD
jgi:hypothetical protein